MSAPGAAASQTFSSHDQSDANVKALGHRYFSLCGKRKVIFTHPEDLKAWK